LAGFPFSRIRSTGAQFGAQSSVECEWSAGGQNVLVGFPIFRQMSYALQTAMGRSVEHINTRARVETEWWPGRTQ
jgi:hypothetical protein